MAYTSEHTAKVIMIPSSVLVSFHDCSVISVASTSVLLLDNFDIPASTSYLWYAFSGFECWQEKWSISESYMDGSYRLKLSFGRSFSSKDWLFPQELVVAGLAYMMWHKQTCRQEKR